VWARLHKIDRIKPQQDGSAIVLVEDERSATVMAHRPALSTLMAIARVLNAQRLLELKYGGKGEVRYATNASMPTFLFDAVRRAGAAVSNRVGEDVLPAQPASVSAIIDQSFSELAHVLRKDTLKFPEGGLATPTKLAQQIVEGDQPVESMATDFTA
jgi:hypothetical protein